MKKVKRFIKMLFNRSTLDEKNQDSRDLCEEYEEANDGVTVIKNVSWLKRKQDSIKEIFLMCMTPYM